MPEQPDVARRAEALVRHDDQGGFPPQEQQPPGLTSRMDPQPDHGEDTYTGHARMAGLRALITGGDSGIGRAVALAYAREGADVAINYLPEEQPDADETRRLVESAGQRAVLVPGDLRTRDVCLQVVDGAVDGLGGLDILVNNAGYHWARGPAGLEGLDPDEMERVLRTNLHAVLWMCHAARPHLSRGSCIINTSSVQAYQPSKQLLDYAATKGAIMIFTKGLAKQLASKGIRVNAVAPGPVWTPLQVTGGQPTDKLPTFGQNTPLGRAGQPAELASLFVLLASPEASFSTAQVFGAAGGRGGP